MRKIRKRILAIVAAMATCVSAMNIPAYAQENFGIESAYVKSSEVETVSEGWDQVTTQDIFEGDNYKITYSLVSHWGTGYNANIRIENTGDTTIHNWYMAFDCEDVITNIWNAKISKEAEKSGNVISPYIIKNAGWNQDIAVGSSVEFGFSSNNSFNGFPGNYELVGTSQEVKEDYTVVYCTNSDWGSGFTGAFSITNNTDSILEDWVLEFDFDREITQIWNGVIESHEGNHYVIRNAEHNSNIDSGRCISFGITGRDGNAVEPSNYKLHTYVSDINLLLDKDLDGDNVPYWMEKEYGSSTKRSDTDNDGINDYDEIFVLSTDPTMRDTDGNGVLDSKEDFDADGINNIDELNAKTNPLSADTDDDGLKDNEESQYGTDPTLSDTDNDGANDGKEVSLNTNPLVYDDSFIVSTVASSEDTVKVSVDIKLSGNQVGSLSVEKCQNEFLFPTNMPGYIGGAYDFSVDGSFDTATIKFEFDEALLSDSSFDPTIYYFNEEIQAFEELDTVIEGNVASTEVTHFSTYILINRTVYQKAFKWTDVWEAGNHSGVEIVLVVDDSWTMNVNDSSNQRLTVARDLIAKLPKNSKVGIVKFASGVTRLTSKLMEDKQLVQSYLTTNYFYSDGYTYMYSAINNAFSLFESKDDEILKMMVVLSDGVAHDLNMHSSMINVAKKNNVNIYTIGLGSGSSSYFTDYMKPLANNTGGAFYLASEAGQLGTIYDDINEKIDIETDSDEDGIADYYEDNMTMFNGLTLPLDKNNPDSDGDGLLDGQEIKLVYQYNNDKSQVIVTGQVISNPLSKDSDDDGIEDPDDTEPMKKGLKDGIIGKLNLVSCYESEDASWTSGNVFLVYTSYIKDKVDFSTLKAGWSKIDVDKSWSLDNLQKDQPLLSDYTFKVNDTVTIANGGFGKENGVCYNMEVYEYYQNNQDYLANTYISEEITEDELKQLISYCSKESVNYFNFTNNSAKVACDAWNLISDVQVNPYSPKFLDGHIATPRGLKDNLRFLSNCQENYSLADALR